LTKIFDYVNLKMAVEIETRGEIQRIL